MHKQMQIRKFHMLSTIIVFLPSCDLHSFVRTHEQLVKFRSIKIIVLQTCTIDL
jgi:hypothetical protein